MRLFTVILLLVTAFSAIIYIFWRQELQYLLPTPIPKDYRVVNPNEVIKFDKTLISQHYSKPKLLHFFNPGCPCSKFNLTHFQALRRLYHNQIDFYVVVANEQKVSSAKEMVDGEIPILVDSDEKLAKACGVYSTPQAAIIQTDNKLYFRGNYNRARYCTDKNSNFVQMALDSLAASKNPPDFGELATHSYGCSIFQEKDIFAQP